MKQRLYARLPHRATVTRQPDDDATGVEAYEATVGEPETVESDLPCRFNDRSTEFVREDSGERVQKPATLTVPADADVQEGDTVNVETTDSEIVASNLEIRGVEHTRDHRRNRVNTIECELERGG